LGQKLDGAINLSAASRIARLHTFLQRSIQPVLTDLKKQQLQQEHDGNAFSTFKALH
jgi:hypothetical protein